VKLKTTTTWHNIFHLCSKPYWKLKEASTHKSAKTHARNVFVTRDPDLGPFDPKINEFPGLILKHFYIKFGELQSFLRHRSEKNTHTNGGKNPTLTTAVGVDNKIKQYSYFMYSGVQMTDTYSVNQQIFFRRRWRLQIRLWAPYTNYDPRHWVNSAVLLFVATYDL